MGTDLDGDVRGRMEDTVASAVHTRQYARQSLDHGPLVSRNPSRVGTSKALSVAGRSTLLTWHVPAMTG